MGRPKTRSLHYGAVLEKTDGRREALREERYGSGRLTHLGRGPSEDRPARDTKAPPGEGYERGGLARPSHGTKVKTDRAHL